MKNIKKTALICLMYLLSQTGYGQSVDPKIYTSPVAIGPTGITARQTGNDVIGSSMGTFRVFVNDGDRFLYWANNTSTFYSSSVAYAATLVNDPDVALVTWNDTAYAVVVYHDVGTGFFCKVFKWSGTAFNVVYQNGLLTGSFTNDCAINVDGDLYGNYVITWNDTSGGIWYATGDAQNNITHIDSICNSSYPSKYKWPDVALFNDGTSNVATFSYVDSPSTLWVEQHAFSLLAAGTITPISPTPLNYSAATGEHFEMYPRVACPPPAGASSDWTVVAQSADKPTSSRIMGWNCNSGTVNAYDYTNPGVLFWDNMTNQNNYFPAVTYDHFYPSGSHPIWIGWTYANSGLSGNTNFDNSDFVLGIPCDPNGAPTSTAIFELQTGQVTNDYSEALSLAGCHNCDIMMTYWMNYTLGGSSFQQGNYLEITNPTSCSSSFRASSNDNSYITNNQVNIQLFSIMGVLINESTIERDEIKSYLRGYSELPGVFILSATDKSGKNDTRKIIFKP